MTIRIGSYAENEFPPTIGHDRTKNRDLNHREVYYQLVTRLFENHLKINGGKVSEGISEDQDDPYADIVNSIDYMDLMALGTFLETVGLMVRREYVLFDDVFSLVAPTIQTCEEVLADFLISRRGEYADSEITAPEQNFTGVKELSWRQIDAEELYKETLYLMKRVQEAYGEQAASKKLGDGPATHNH